MWSMLTSHLVFILWWLLIRNLMYYAEINFILYFTGSNERKSIPFYIGINALLTVIAIQTKQVSFFGFFHILLLFLYSSIVLKIKLRYAVAPIVIIFTLSTIMEGFAAVLIRFFSLTLKSQLWWLILPFILPVVMAFFFFQVLHLISRKYQLIDQAEASTYFYILLLPCVWTVWQIKSGIRGDSTANHPNFTNGTVTNVLYASLWMAGILVAFFVIIEMFYKVTLLSEQEMEKALLTCHVKEQCSYIDEAWKRNQGYQSFQHDINNHLLVITGLLKDAQYQKAENYLQKLNVAAMNLSEDTSTGNSVLDVLLGEKFRYAKLCGISVTSHIQIPKNSGIDDIDLCILFSNGIDYVMAGCLNVEATYKTIEINAWQKHGFLLLDMSSGVAPSEPIVYGTGLKIIKLTAEKYGGTICTEQKEDYVSLSIKLGIDSPQRKEPNRRIYR